MMCILLSYLHHTVDRSTSLCGVMPRAYSQLQTALGLVDRPSDAVAADVLVVSTDFVAWYPTDDA